VNRPDAMPLAVRPPTSAESPWRVHEETMLLPTFVTGGRHAGPDGPALAGYAVDPDETNDSDAGAPSPTLSRIDDDRLPTDERNMLIFVTALLALGTLAIVAMASIGR
jgi:hypothetical protein